jgi:hypothetical protein
VLVAFHHYNEILEWFTYKRKGLIWLTAVEVPVHEALSLWTPRQNKTIFITSLGAKEEEEKARVPQSSSKIFPKGNYNDFFGIGDSGWKIAHF